jgi:hypothetical protein
MSTLAEQMDDARSWIEGIEAQLQQDIDAQAEGRLNDMLADQTERLESLQSEYARQAPPQPKPKTDPKSKLSGEVGSIRQRIALLEADDSPEDVTARMLAVKKLQERETVIESRLPYVSVTSDDLSTAIEDADIRREELEVEAQKWPKGSASWERAQQGIEAAVLERVQAAKELETRQTVDRGLAARAHFAQTQAVAAAQAEWRARWDAELAEMSKYQTAVPGLTLEGAPPQWKLDRARAMRKEPAPADMVEAHRKRIEAEQQGQSSALNNAQVG